jgi:hypothetical protein
MTSFVVLEVQKVLGILESPDELLALWNATYEIPIPMRDYYSTLIALQNQQAKQNRTSAVTHSHSLIEFVIFFLNQWNIFESIDRNRSSPSSPILIILILFLNQIFFFQV